MSENEVDNRLEIIEAKLDKIEADVEEFAQRQEISPSPQLEQAKKFFYKTIPKNLPLIEIAISFVVLIMYLKHTVAE